MPHELYGHEADLDIAPNFTAVAAVCPNQPQALIVDLLRPGW